MRSVVLPADDRIPASSPQGDSHNRSQGRPRHRYLQLGRIRRRPTLAVRPCPDAAGALVGDRVEHHFRGLDCVQHGDIRRSRSAPAGRPAPRSAGANLSRPAVMGHRNRGCK